MQKLLSSYSFMSVQSIGKSEDHSNAVYPYIAISLDQDKLA